MRFALILALLLQPAFAQATCPTYFYPKANVYAQPYVAPQQKFYQTFYVFTPGLAIGLNTTGYGPAPTESPCSAEIKTLREEIARLKATMSPAVAPQSPKPPSMAPVGDRPSASAIVRHCSSCHDTTTAKTLGGGLELTAFGQTLKLKAATAGKVLESANPVKGTMPKDHPRLTGEQFNELVKELIVQQSQ